MVEIYRELIWSKKYNNTDLKIYDLLIQLGVRTDISNRKISEELQVSTRYVQMSVRKLKEGGFIKCTIKNRNKRFIDVLGVRNEVKSNQKVMAEKQKNYEENTDISYEKEVRNESSRKNINTPPNLPPEGGDTTLSPYRGGESVVFSSPRQGLIWVKALFSSEESDLIKIKNLKLQEVLKIREALRMPDRNFNIIKSKFEAKELKPAASQAFLKYISSYNKVVAFIDSLTGQLDLHQAILLSTEVTKALRSILESELTVTLKEVM